MKMYIKNIFHRLYIILKFPKGLIDFILDSISYLFKMTYILGRPVNATIELTNLCNLRCPVCETGANILKRERGIMSLNNYRIIIDKLSPFTNTVLLYYMGEPFLNKDIYEIIKYTKSKNIFVKVCTNGENFDPIKTIQSGLDEIQIQIGGISQETHAIYRLGGVLSETLDNVKALINAKSLHIKEIGLVKTKIYLGLILMKHNEHELKDFFSLADELGVDGARIESPGVRDMEQGKVFLPIDKRYWLYDINAFESGILRHKDYQPNHCRWMYYSITVTWEGNVIPCCRDVDGQYLMGNLLEDNISAIWNGERFRSFRKKMLQDSKSIPMCILCDGLTYPSMEKI